MGVVGAAIKGFGKALKRNKASKQVFDHVKGKPFPKSTQKHMYQSAIRRKAMKQAGYKKEPYADSGKRSKTGSIKIKEMWSYNPYKKSKPSKLKKILKDPRTKGLATGAVIGGAYKLGEEKGKGKK